MTFEWRPARSEEECSRQRDRGTRTLRLVQRSQENSTAEVELVRQRDWWNRLFRKVFWGQIM